jgi:hypothetical protein
MVKYFFVMRKRENAIGILLKSGLDEMIYHVVNFSQVVNVQPAASVGEGLPLQEVVKSAGYVWKQVK